MAPGTKKTACWALWLIALLLAVNWGGSAISLAGLFSQDELLQSIFFKIRLPRVAVAALCGGSLACAGVLSQGLFQNALASPSIIGTESGAMAAAVLSYYLGIGFDHWLNVPLAAFAGAIIATMVVLYFSSRQFLFSLSQLLLIGLALNTLFAACTTLVVSLTLENYERFQAVMYWLLGGLAGKSWEHVAMGVPFLIIGLSFGLRLASRLNHLALGQEVAESLGISIQRLRWQSLVTIGILVAGAVTIAGAITFVGLIVPHLTRVLLGADNRRLLLYSTLNGMTLVLLADLLARTLRQPLELQVGVMVALLGAPFFVCLLWQDQRTQCTGS